jgi:hypothetical protein
MCFLGATNRNVSQAHIKLPKHEFTYYFTILSWPFLFMNQFTSSTTNLLFIWYYVHSRKVQGRWIIFPAHNYVRTPNVFTRLPAMTIGYLILCVLKFWVYTVHFPVCQHLWHRLDLWFLSQTYSPSEPFLWRSTEYLLLYPTKNSNNHIYHLT